MQSFFLICKCIYVCHCVLVFFSKASKCIICFIGSVIRPFLPAPLFFLLAHPNFNNPTLKTLIGICLPSLPLFFHPKNTKTTFTVKQNTTFIEEKKMKYTSGFRIDRSGILFLIWKYIMNPSIKNWHLNFGLINSKCISKWFWIRQSNNTLKSKF